MQGGRARWLACYLLPPLLYMGLIFWLSAIERWDRLPRRLRAQDKPIHLVEYAVLGALWYRLLARTRLRPGQALLLAGLIGALYGVTDELHQLHVPGRYYDHADMAADAAGAFLGAGLLWWRGRA